MNRYTKSATAPENESQRKIVSAEAAAITET